MKKTSNSLISFLIVVVSLHLLVPISEAGSTDIWASCCVSGCDFSPGESTTFDTQTFYCCCLDGDAGWTTSSCSYPKNVPYCDKGGETYFADQQNSDCSYSDRDNICRSAGSLGTDDDCTADPACNNIEADSVLDDTCSFGNPRTKDKCSSTCSLEDTNICDADCGADASCDNKQIGESCGLNSICNSNCQCELQCVRANPTVALSPYSQKGRKGETLTYTLTITNNDNSACGDSDFEISFDCPPQLSCPSTFYLTISPGSTQSIDVEITSDPTADEGTYDFMVMVKNLQDASYFAIASSSYVVVYICCPSISLSCPSEATYGENFDCTLNYSHSENDKGGIMVRWDTTDFDFVSISGCTPTHYDDPDFAPGWEGIECVDVPPGSSLTLTLKPISSGSKEIFYRAWDSSQDAYCSPNTWDYDRDPSNGTCSANCDSFPEDWEVCDSYSTTLDVKGTLTISPSESTSETQDVFPGETAQYDLTIQSLGDFEGYVDLSVSNCPETCWLSESTVYLSAGGSNTTTLYVDTSEETEPGTYTITITGTSDGTISSTDVTLKVMSTTECNFNYICEYPEIQEGCPSDCKTTIEVIPAQAFSNDFVIVRIWFNDSRYGKGNDGMLNLTIVRGSEEKLWGPPLCNISGKKWTDLGWNPSERPEGCIDCGGLGINITSENYYVKIESVCQLPPLPAGTYKIRVTPTIYSSVILLLPAEKQIIILGEGKPKENILSILLNLLRRFFPVQKT